jgi:two-component system response regulator ResD
MSDRIMVVEDDAALRDLVTAYLGRAGYAVEGYDDGRMALEAALAAPPDLVVLDLMLPGVDGLTIAARLRDAAPGTAIIMLTARSTEQDRIQGLSAGADDYVVKPFSPAELVLRVQAVLRRLKEGQGAGRALRLGALVLDPVRHVVSVGDRGINLTPTEFRILEVLMSRPGWTFTRQQLLDAALGPDFGGFDRNVDVHIANLRKKLRLTPSPIRTVYGVGYRLDPDTVAPTSP